MENIYLKLASWVGKVLVLIVLAYLFVGLFFVENTIQLAIGFFVTIFITLPTIFIFFFKGKFLAKYPKLIIIWKIIRIIYIISVILFIVCLFVGEYIGYKNSKTSDAVDLINSKKITLDDVMGKNLPLAPDQKVNDATIAGIDANKNFIRDDVELAIFKKYPDSAKIRAAELQYAQALQLELTQVYSSETLVAVMQKKDAAYFCLGDSQKLSLNDLNEAEKKIEDLIINTIERKNLRADLFAKYMAGYSSPAGDTCDEVL